MLLYAERVPQVQRNAESRNHRTDTQWRRKGEIGEVAPNLLERNFKTNAPNRKWVTDVTEFKVNEQKLYLSPIIDLFNGEVVSYNLSRHPDFKQITDMLEKAIIEYIDYYNNRRIKLKLNGLSPVQYRIQTVQVA